MSKEQIWFITGVGRDMGVDIAKAALAAGPRGCSHRTQRRKFSSALGADNDLLAVKLDVTSLDDAKDAVHAAVDRFGRDRRPRQRREQLLPRFFEEITPANLRVQIEATMFGAMNVTHDTCGRARPALRAQRNTSSTAGIAGQEFCTAYAASKFGIEGLVARAAPQASIFVAPAFARAKGRQGRRRARHSSPTL